MTMIEGRVVRILSDDTKGIQHQRFIVERGDGRTFLVAHNMDVAGRIPGLKNGSVVRVAGDYEWNELGGLLHWTHKDAEHGHEGGWIEFEGQRFE